MPLDVECYRVKRQIYAEKITVYPRRKQVKIVVTWEASSFHKTACGKKLLDLNSILTNRIRIEWGWFIKMGVA